MVIITILQIILALIILNVWLFRVNKATEFRGGNAKNMQEEFAVYGLPCWFMYLVGFLKITSSILLLIGIWIHVLAMIGAIGLAVLMFGAVCMHIKVKDSFTKTYPSLVMLIIAVIIAIFI